ncbi:uncharacterized protein METZ01_LOCUS124805, partial [marine metagenome]
MSNKKVLVSGCDNEPGLGHVYAGNWFRSIPFLEVLIYSFSGEITAVN